MSAPRYRMDHLHYRSPRPEEAAAWWKTMFGAEEKARLTTPAGTLRIILGLAGQDIFVEEVAEGAGSPPPAPHRGLEHIGLAVDDIEAAAADITAKGGQLARPVTSPRPGVRICFVAGPDGTLVELIERR
ncbi:MAG: VOC family protein [Rhodovarius sp.]|nr:VOC family protein [Rhodovarius sp.]MDW8314388.1 VOC family protein [Rhodovarius sp.]